MTTTQINTDTNRRRISQLPIVKDITGNEMIPASVNGETVRMSVSDISKQVSKDVAANMVDKVTEKVKEEVKDELKEIVDDASNVVIGDPEW